MKISIITAAYNSGATLKDTMESVLRQSFDDWEHIIVDGGSTDATLDIIHDAEPRYNGRLKWISEPDKGIYDAMNKGIAMAQGDVIGILNSDDFYSSQNTLRKVADAMESMPEVDAVYGDIHFVKDSNLSKCTRYYSSRFFRPWMMLFGYQPAHPSFYCRKKVYDKYGCFDLDFKVAADFDNLLRLIYINRINTEYIGFDFVTMRAGGASTSGLRSHNRIIRDHRKSYRKHNLTIGYCLDFVRYPIKLLELYSYRFGHRHRIPE